MGKISTPKYELGDVIRGWYSDLEYRIISASLDAGNKIQYSIIPEQLKTVYKMEDVRVIPESGIRCVVWPAHLQRKSDYGTCTCGAKKVGHPSHMWYCGALGGTFF